MRVILLALTLTSAAALAQTDAEKRCARRLCTTLGLPWRNELTALATSTPQANVRRWLDHRNAIQNFAAFVNSRFNPAPGVNTSEDAVLQAVKFVLTNNRPWRDVFVGRLFINHTNGQVTEDPALPALGYFGSRGWQYRYRGNEEAGLMLSAAYRTLQNTVGLKLIAAPNNAEGDSTATGRERPECRSCHFDSPYALDKVAQLLPRRVGIGAGAKVEVVPVAPQQLFGAEVSSHEQLLQTLVGSQAFLFWSCRLAFEFAWGRKESACEAPMFDRCVDALATTGDMKAGLAALLEDPAYCEVTP